MNTKKIKATEVREYVLSNGNKLTNEVMAKNLNISATRVANAVKNIKKNRKIAKNFFATDRSLISSKAQATMKANNEAKKQKYVVGEYNNASGMGKAEARAKMVFDIKKSPTKNFNILSLPADNCLIEKKILKEVSSKYNFIGCEYKENVYFKLLNTIAKEKIRMSAHLGSVSDIIYKSKENEFAHIVLDYCGTFQTFQNEIAYAIQNKLVEVNGTISITISERDSGEYNLMNRINEIAPSKDNDLKINHNIKTYLSIICGMNFKVETSFRYNDTGANMSLFVLKRLS